MNKKLINVSVILLTAIIILTGCGQSKENKQIVLATTTSFQDSGLMDVILQEFNKAEGYTVKPIAVGSGEAMAMGKRGEADVMIVHSPKDEEAFMSEGFGKSRTTFMYNDYVLVGPETDPANCISATSIADAFARIAQSKSMFISRGDKSGTHKKEQSIWAKANIKPAGEWYVEAGQGMGEVLNMANVRAAYTLSDRGTYLSHRAKTALPIVRQGDKELLNNYSVIVVNPAKFPKVNLTGAEAFAAFLARPETLKLISEFSIDKYGEPLFHIYEEK